MSTRKLVLLLAVLGSAGPALAQRTAIAPLAPVTPAVAAPQPLGQPIDFGTSRQRPATPITDQPLKSVRPQPFYLVNSRIIVGIGLARINSRNIANVYVYRVADAPVKWRGLATNGLIDITLKLHIAPSFKTKSVAAIGRGLKLRGAVSYQLEGLPLEDLNLRVATADIASLDTQQTDSGTVVNIRLARFKSTVYPPGTIMIRGASGS